MRSEKEGAGGPRAAVVARGPCGREKLSALEVQFHRDSPQREAETQPTSSSGCGGGAGKPREEKRTALSKVVIRRLPPGLTKEQLEEQLRPLPAHDYFEFFAADLSLYPHLYSRAYINFRNPDDILLFRDRFDGYIFLDSKDPEYKKFLETYCVEEEKSSANPETLLGEMEAKTRELIARRTTPLLEYIKNRKLEKQRIREEKREERRRRELEKKRLREEEKRRRREEERCKKKETDKQKKIAEKEVRIKLLKKPEKGEEPTTEKPKERGEEIDTGGGRPVEGSLEKSQEMSRSSSDKEYRDVERSQEKESEAQRHHVDDGRRHRAHHEPDWLSRRSEDEQRWGKGPGQDRGRKGSQDSGAPGEAMERLGRAQRCDDGPAPRKERLANKDRPALQLYDPGARFRARECGGSGRICKAEGSGTGPEKREEAE
ncbi:regulator of nonsense transcripts 3A isoform X2 [Trachypithecus francoisi]|uniref:regulator of nonsense transcripts 3A isoform X2 n=1 Tax=Trachypithecus francoisi TaxID=54180 RepID=UPI00141A6A07|nr:regulator of nonsense transcripts 3A isoform X2 [Trachypithecus francoisi]